MFLTKEQVELLTLEQCTSALDNLIKTYPLDQDVRSEIWPLVDDIANTLLYLEDRVRYLQQSEVAINANKARYGRI
jgi:hypothetical protein